jgi:hypothetical protein
VIDPMMADLSLYQAIPGLLESLPDGLRAQAERFQLATKHNRATLDLAFLCDQQY